jgi:putative porin
MTNRFFRISCLALVACFMSRGRTEAADVEVGKIPINFSLEFRIRSEYIDNNGFNNEDYRWRQRYRLRFGATAAVTEHFSAGFRLSSGDPLYQTTAYRTFDSTNFSKADFTVDRAYVGYKAQGGPVLTTLYLGKFAHPFYTPSEIVWDVDLQPAGAAELFTFNRSGVTIALGQYVIRERDQAKGVGSNLFAGQVSWKKDFAPVAVGFGVGYYHIDDPLQVANDAKASNTDFLTNKNFSTCTGLNPGTCTGTISDFRILNVSTDEAFKRVPIRFVGEYVDNLGAKDGLVGGIPFGKENKAWLAAIYYGRTKDKGDWRIGGGYTEIQADAVVANFNSDDLQQTNVNTIFTEVRFQLHPKSYVYYDGYYQRKNNFDLFQANGNPVPDDTRVYRHRITLVVEF